MAATQLVPRGLIKHGATTVAAKLLVARGLIEHGATTGAATPSLLIPMGNGPAVTKRGLRRSAEAVTSLWGAVTSKRGAVTAVEGSNGNLPANVRRLSFTGLFREELDSAEPSTAGGEGGGELREAEASGADGTLALPPRGNATQKRVHLRCAIHMKVEARGWSLGRRIQYHTKGCRAYAGGGSRGWSLGRRIQYHTKGPSRGDGEGSCATDAESCICRWRLAGGRTGWSSRATLVVQGEQGWRCDVRLDVRAALVEHGDRCDCISADFLLELELVDLASAHHPDGVDERSHPWHQVQRLIVLLPHQPSHAAR